MAKLTTIRQMASKNPTDTELSNDPIKFFGSQASQWQARSNRTGTPDGTLWYQPLVVVASVSAFLIYFCILREENDIDQELEVSLYERVDGLEAANLILSYRYNLENGLKTDALEKRMQELGIQPESIK
jgi:CCSMST1 family